MTDRYDDDNAFENDPDRFENLPPVEPPSAGFIVQLFVVPALIVLAVVGVWALFGKLAAGEQDWRTLVAQLRHENEHRRWRGAMGLAQLLKADEQKADSSGRLAQNPQVAQELATMLHDQLAKSAPEDDDLKHQAFLALTLGMLDSPDAVLPVLSEGMDAANDREVRKNSIASVALIAGRMDEKGEPLRDKATVEHLIGASQDADTLLRQMAAYALGLAPSEESQQRLGVLLADPDVSTRMNAAIALARQGSTGGLAMFESVLSDGAQGEAPSHIDPDMAENRVFEQLVSLKNALKAISDLSGRLSSEERTRIRALVAKIAESYHEPRIRLDAQQTLRALDGQAA